jgi:O-acetyl-ADP-ribose deacetylase (regulator of RNase III)
MFNVKVGDMFAEVKDGYIMHGCNAHGVMGSGVAKIIRDKYPIAYEQYHAQHPNYFLGEVIPVIVEPNIVVVNAITQENFGTDVVQVDYNAVEQACKGVKHLAASGMIASKEVHFPFIGAGLAGGDEHTLMTIFDLQFSDGEDSDNPNSINGTLWLLPDHWMAAIVKASQ